MEHDKSTTFTNSFHGTSTTVRTWFRGKTQREKYQHLCEIVYEENDKNGRYTRMQKRIAAKLCGWTGCNCGTIR